MASHSRVAKVKVPCKSTNANGEPCGNTAVYGSEHCHSHRKGAMGIDNPRFVHGKYSKVLRRDVLDEYLRSKEQEDMYSQVDEIALLDARISLLLKALDNKDGLRLFDSISEIMLDMQEMVEEEDREITGKDIQMFAAKLSSVVTEAKAERRRWQEIYDVMDVRRKLIESDRKRILEQQEYLTKQQALVLVTTILNVIHKNIQDESTFRTIRAELDELSRIDLGRWSIAQSRG